MPTEKIAAKYMIDLHGLMEALTTTNNQIRHAFIDSLNSGELKVIKSASSELKDIDEDAYNDFQSLKNGSVYVRATVADDALQASLMSKNGASIFGVAPPSDRFLALAICIREKLCLISAGSALKDCNKISKKCSLKSPKILSLVEFASG